MRQSTLAVEQVDITVQAAPSSLLPLPSDNLNLWDINERTIREHTSQKINTH
jgi:hypothetical protein